MQAKRSTIYLDPDIHKALRLKAVETSRSISALVNEAVRESHAEDAEGFEKRASEPLLSNDERVGRRKDIFG